MWKWKKEKWKDGNVNVNCVWVLCGDEDGREMWVGIFRGKKGKRKMERRYGKNGLRMKWKVMVMVMVKKIGGRKNGDWGGVYINE